MDQLTKKTRKLLREAMELAYQKELAGELERLHRSFERWRRGECSAFDLSEDIHQFHQGPNRKLCLRYAEGDPLLTVAGAVSAGILRLDELHADLHEPIKGILPVFGSDASSTPDC